MKPIFITHLRSQWSNILFAFRATTAAISALVIAELLALECPYWAALTALIVIQPSRGLILEKSFYRLVGTCIGSLAGLLLLLNVPSPLPLTLGLGLWVGTCVAIATLFYGLRSYACSMAGMTCAVIAMGGTLNGSHLHEMALSRVLCIIVGIGVATVITAFVTPRRSITEISARLDRLTVESIHWVARHLRAETDSAPRSQQQRLLLEIAETESLLDVVLAGSLRPQRKSREAMALMSALLNLLGVGQLLHQQQLTQIWQQPSHQQPLHKIAALLDLIATTRNSDQARNLVKQLIKDIRELQEEHPTLRPSLEELLLSLRHILQYRHILEGERNVAKPGFSRHRDWREGVRAALRVFCMLSSGGLVWSLTGWHYAPVLIMALTIMLTLFATKDHPSRLLRHVLPGAATGAAIAILCQTLLLAGHGGATLEHIVMVPFLLLGAWGMTQKRTAIAATDATFIFILTLQPGLATQVRPFDMLFGALAMLTGIACSWLAYRYLFPINPHIRLQALLASVNKDIQALALVSSPNAIMQTEAQMRHKIIRIVCLARHHDSNYLSFVDGGMLALATMTSFQQLRKLFADPEVPENVRTLLQKALRASEVQPDYAQLAKLMAQVTAMTQTMMMEEEELKGGTSHQCVVHALETAGQLLSENVIFYGARKNLTSP